MRAAVLALGLGLCATAYAQPAIDAALEAYRRGDAVAALNLLHPSADGGNPEAQFTLGMVLEFGLGREQEAAGWYRKAADSGHAAAANSLGAMHFDGRGVPKDRGRARELYLVAALKDYAPAQYNLAQLYGQGPASDHAQMIVWLERAAKSGYARAQAQLGRLRMEGIGIARDLAAAAHWFRAAADQDDPHGQYFLSVLLRKGAGVEPNPEQARAWLEKAAGQGHDLACFDLARSYELGLDFPADNGNALHYYRKAADAGYALAIERLAKAYRNGELGLARDPTLEQLMTIRLRLVHSREKS